MYDWDVCVYLLTRLVVVPCDRLDECLYLARLGALLRVRVRDLQLLVAIMFCVDMGAKTQGAGWARSVCLNSHGWPTFSQIFHLHTSH